MSNIVTHDVSAIARARLGRTAQVDALAPRAPTPTIAIDWNSRRRRTLLGNFRRQFRPNNIELGEIILSEASDPEGCAAALISAGGGPIEIDFSRQITYVLTLETVTNEFAAVTTPPIPFGFAVTQCAVSWYGLTTVVEAGIAWNLLLVNSDVPVSSADAPSGEKLLDPINTSSGSPSLREFGAPIGHQPFGAITTGPLGRYNATPGKRLAFVAQDSGGGHDVDMAAIITVAPINGGGGTFRTTCAPRGDAGAPAPTLPPGDWEQIF